MDRIFLLPGEFHATKKPCEINTVLGSCVSICLHNSGSGLAAMNHYVFPESSNPEETDKGRYGSTAIDLVIRSLLAVDPVVGHYTAQIYGGATPLRTEAATGVSSGIGERNVAIAEKLLAERGIKVTARKTGGPRGYRIHFDTSTAQVRVEEILGASERAATIKKKRILIVDDSPTVCKVLQTVIASTNEFEVCGVANDAYQARDMLVSLEPDLMTLDIIMPKMDGISFLKKVMQFKPMPVLICSTIAKEGSAIFNDAKAAGASDVIDKDTLQLYQGTDKVLSVLKPKLMSALARFSPNRASI